jgi:hypothetical protein
MGPEAMRRLIFQVAVGETPAFYGPCMQSVREYAERIGADYKYMTEPQLRIVPKNSQRSENALRLGYLPIFEKEFAFSYLGEYDAVAIVDADMFVTPYAPDVFEAAGGVDFAGVVERDLPLLPEYERKLIQYSKQQYRPLEDVDWKWNRLGAEFYNMGMMVLSSRVLPYLKGQSPKEFIERPEFERFVNGEGKWRWSTDQTLLNWWVKHSGMRRANLEWRWNTLYSYVKPESLALRPYFIHFNLASLFERGGDEIPELVKRFT